MNRRGEQTHAKLLDAATRLFSERGFDGVSTREIATAAGTTLPAIAHHFESKRGLYNAVLAAIGEGLETQLSAAVGAARDVLAEPRLTRREAIATLQNLISAHARAVLSGRPDWVALVVREQLRPLEPRYAIQERMFEVHLLAPVLQLIGFLRGEPPSHEAVKLQALMLTGRVLSFRAMRRVSLRLLKWKHFEQEEIERVVASLREEVASVFAMAPSQRDKTASTRKTHARRSAGRPRRPSAPE